VTLSRDTTRASSAFNTRPTAATAILECHTVSGDDDYLLKVVARDLKSLSQFLTDRLMQVPGVDDVRSMIFHGRGQGLRALARRPRHLNEHTPHQISQRDPLGRPDATRRMIARDER